jgi:hypothetical protein
VTSRARIPCAVLLTACAWLWSADAHAKGIILITHGDRINHTSEVTPAVWQAAAGKLPARNVGYKYSYFGIFWVDLWTWGGTWCLYKGNQYWPLTAEQAALFLGKSEKDLSRPFLYLCPLGLDIIVPLIVLGLVVKVFRRPPPNLLADERYRAALDIFHAEMARTEPPALAAPPPQGPEGAIQTAPPAPTPAPDPAVEEAQQQKRIAGAFEAAVTHLTTNGIPRAEAEEKLSLLLSALQSAAPEGSPTEAVQPEPGPASPPAPGAPS